ncbi:DUF6879 family protein [Nonomuraea sp. NPDC049480]|uniref:DUF6879 family protein n=1 Tax=Nonomuraea sp. NPDC049480 TaxID=3364353 RepID=UPI0037981C51
MTPEEFNACFDRFTTSVFRLEARQHYTVPDEDADMHLWQQGHPLPDRSVRTSPWLRRIAVTTAAGKYWSRVHLVDLPLSPYLEFEFAGYLENAAAGEEIRVAIRRDHPEMAELQEDFWLFDGGTPDAYGLTMQYDDDGRYVGSDLVTDPDRLAEYQKAREMAWTAAMPLNAFMARSASHWHAS